MSLLNLPIPDKCYLHQAVLWIAEGKTPLPEEAYRATQPSLFPTSGIPTASETLPNTEKIEKIKEDLLVALRMKNLSAEGNFHHNCPIDGNETHENPHQIPLEHWQSDRVDWEGSKLTLISPTGILTIRRIKVPTKPLFEMFPREVVGALKGETIVVAMGKTAEEPKDKSRPPSRKRRKRSTKEDALLKNRIERVIAAARRKWPDPKKRPDTRVMAKDLAADTNLGYGEETIRKILEGRYRPAKELGILGLSG